MKTQEHKCRVTTNLSSKFDFSAILCIASECLGQTEEQTKIFVWICGLQKCQLVLLEEQGKRLHALNFIQLGYVLKF